MVPSTCTDSFGCGSRSHCCHIKSFIVGNVLKTYETFLQQPYCFCILCTAEDRGRRRAEPFSCHCGFLLTCLIFMTTASPGIVSALWWGPLPWPTAFGFVVDLVGWTCLSVRHWKVWCGSVQLCALKHRGSRMVCVTLCPPQTAMSLLILLEATPVIGAASCE